MSGMGTQRDQDYTDFNDIPRRKYNIIYADPAWDYGATKHLPFGGTEKHYQTMKTADICSLPISDIAADDCFLFMWVTFPLMAKRCKRPDGKESKGTWLDVMECWGFEYKTVGFAWMKMQKNDPSKPRMGVGWYTKSNIEVCLLAVKGNPHLKFMGTKGHRPTPCLCNNIHSEVVDYIDDPIVLAARGKHSAKPAEVRSRIVESCGDIPRIELFAREKSEGWDAWARI